MKKIQDSQSVMSGDKSLSVYAAFDRLNQEDRGQIGDVIPGEVGAINTIAPILVAIEKEIPAIDRG